MKPVTWFSALAVVAAVGATTLAYAQDEHTAGPGGDDFMFADFHDEMAVDMRGAHARGARGGHRRGMPPLEAIEELGLSDAQREKLADLREQRMKAAIPIEADVKLAQIDLEKLLRADQPDKNAVSRQADRIAALRANLMKNRLSGMIEARAVLTSEQQKKLKELRLQAPERTERRGRQG
jgi:Spy/CpxP family protein refolding chaperone